jgi:hypothetical protein
MNVCSTWWSCAVCDERVMYVVKVCSTWCSFVKRFSPYFHSLKYFWLNPILFQSRTKQLYSPYAPFLGKNKVTQIYNRQLINYKFYIQRNIIGNISSFLSRKLMVLNLLYDMCLILFENTVGNRLVSITKLMHNSFILQYMYYVVILDMIRAILCS